MVQPLAGGHLIHGDLHLDNRLVVRLSRHRLQLWRGQKLVARFPVALGTASTPTPRGLFYVVELRKPHNPGGTYGPYSFGISAHSEVLKTFAGGDGRVGLHGTNQPDLIGTDVSHGCIRLRNAPIRRLAKILPLGTPVYVRALRLVSSGTELPMPIDEILGRDDELAVIDEVLQRTAARPVALVIEGQAGIGKTTLWRHALSLARDRSYRVLSSSPSEAETSLSFGGIADLLAEEADRAFSSLPPPQARALDVALRRSDPNADRVDEYAIRAAFLGVLRTVAQEGDAVVAIDDVQWLDAPSALALEFALRRLEAEAITFVLAHREADGALPIGIERASPQLRVVQLPVGPLSLGAIHGLVSARTGMSIRRPLLRKIHQIAQGNPFFAIELAREVERHPPELAAAEPLPLPRSLQRVVHGRLARLTPTTAEVLLAVSSLSQPTMPLLERAFGRERVAAALEEASAAGILELERGQVRFAHPLLASGCYGSASADSRRRIHGLAASLVADSEERARHLALTGEGQDEDVASELQRAADHAASRGAPEIAAELAELAVERTPPERCEALVERALQAGDHRLRSGDARGARRLFERALEAAASGRDRAEALLRLAQIAADLDDAVELGRRALADSDDAAQGCRVHQLLAGACLARGLGREGVAHARRSLELAERLRDDSLLAGALTCAAELEYIAGESKAALALLERALDMGDGRSPPLRWSPRLSLARWHSYSGRGQEASNLLSALLEDAVDRGDEWTRIWILQELSWVEGRAARFDVADRLLHDAIAVSEQAGLWNRTLLLSKAYLDAQLGRVDDSRSAARECVELGIEGKSEGVRRDALAILGFLELSVGDLAAANEHLSSLPADALAAGQRFPSAFGTWANAIEVLSSIGERQRAEEYLAQYEELAAEYDIPWQCATAARCRGLLEASRGALPKAFESFEHALIEHKRTVDLFEEARTQLAYGVALRRAKRRREARERLEAARVLFEQLGTPLWEEKARNELARISGRRTESGLTPTQQRIAVLVAAGRTNKQVAAELSVTPKTVETGLSRIYAKLGIHSRVELARRVLDESNDRAAKV